MKSLRFRKVEDKIYPTLQLVGTFIITDEILWRGELEVRPLTVKDLFAALIRNEARILYYRLARALYHFGFLNTPEACALDWRKDWRWDFLIVRRERILKRREDNANH